MSPIRVTWARTAGMIRGQYSAVLALAAFLAATAATFLFNLEAAEGGRLPLPAIWAMSVSPVLPLLAAVLGMDVWSGERQSGNIDLLLTTAVRELDFAWGKFLGVWTWLATATVVSLVFTLATVGVFAPSALSGVASFGMVPALGILLVQGALWSAVSLAVSAWFVRPAAAAVTTMVLTAALPRAIWAGLMAWSDAGRTAFGEMPLDAHAVDCASGAVSLSMIGGYLALTVLALFMSSKTVNALRYVGRGAASLRWTTRLTLWLAAVLSVLLVMLCGKYEFAVELPIGSGGENFSARTRQVLSDSSGDIFVTCFLSRKDPRFRDVGNLLRSLRRASASLGGARLELRYVDPRWDLGEAERLLRRGIESSSLVFERGRRQAVLPLADGFGERLCASAIRRVSIPAQGRSVYWAVGHGEARFDAYGPFGMSDVARELVQSGYRNAVLDLSVAAAIPGDCSLIVVAGARTDFSRTEIGRIDSYLREGGRLLVLLNSVQSGGVVSLLPSWGVRTKPLQRAGVRTLSGTDVIARDFGEHVISASLRGSQLLLESPVAFAPSAIAETGVGVDRLEYSALAEVGGSAVAVAVERGASAGSDLALRPTRIVAVGDATFAMNGPLAARANANRDFFLNCVAYLSGTEGSGDGTESSLLRSGLDRGSQRLFLLVHVGVLPVSVLLVMMTLIAYRRHRR